MDEIKIEKMLNIKTSGRDDTRANTFNYPYEATSYNVLDRLIQSGLIDKKNLLVDYGCGKGRVPFYLSYEIGCKSLGIEYDKRLYNRALGNLEGYNKKDKVSFINCNASKYNPPIEADRFFFFNPFSVEVLQSVILKIIRAYFDGGCEKEMFLFFYYPSDEYISYLMQEEYLEFYDEIDCRDLFPDSDEVKRECILIFEMVI